MLEHNESIPDHKYIGCSREEQDLERCSILGRISIQKTPNKHEWNDGKDGKDFTVPVPAVSTVSAADMGECKECMCDQHCLQEIDNPELQLMADLDHQIGRQEQP